MFIMSRKNKNDNFDYGNLPSNYLVNLGKQCIKSKKTKDDDIVKDKYGNCTLEDKHIEANACSMVKNNYDKK